MGNLTIQSRLARNVHVIRRSTVSLLPQGQKCCEFEDKLLAAYNYSAAHLDIYEGTGPNSNTFVQDIVNRVGGSAEFPPNAFGAVDLIDAVISSPLGQALFSTVPRK